MNLEGLRSNKVRVAVGVLVLLAVVGGAYLTLADRTVEISNAEELQNMNNDLDADYVLVDDIDASKIENFEPIGGLEEPFTGTFDGNGHTISNLTIHRPREERVGLFGYVDGARIRNVGLEDVNVTGGTLVGGLVGDNNNCEVRESYVTGEIDGNITVGGVVGRNVGGHERPGMVVDSYSESNVSGNESVGGVVGYNNGRIVRSYAVGEVTGNSDIGGLTGYQDSGGVIRDSYWDTDTTGRTSPGVGTNTNTTGRTGVAVFATDLTTSEMTGSAALKNMEGFDFRETWRTTEDDYPRLAWQNDSSEGGNSED